MKFTITLKKIPEKSIWLSDETLTITNHMEQEYTLKQWYRISNSVLPGVLELMSYGHFQFSAIPRTPVFGVIFEFCKF